MTTYSPIVNVKVSSGSQVCPCDQYFDTVLGQCAPLTPNSISVNTLVQKYPFWMLFYNCGFGGAGASGPCSGFEGENLSSCQFGSGLCNSDTYKFRVTGTVFSGSTPVCNQVLNWSTSLPENLTLAWHTPDNKFQGSFVIGYALDGNTNSEGKFNAEFTVSIQNLTKNINCDPFTPPSPQSIGSVITNWVMTVSLEANPSISKTINIEMQSTMCEQIGGL